MPEDRSPSDEARTEHKHLGKHKWRGKLFSADGRFGKRADDLESTEDDVTNFLQTATTKPNVGVQAAARKSLVAIEDPECASIVDIYRGPKPRQNKGLRVTFDTAAPKIIGVGGDKAESAPIQVLESSRDAVANAVTQIDQHVLDVVKSPPSDKQDPLLVSVEEPKFRPTHLQRRPTGLSDIFGDEIWNTKDQDVNVSVQGPVKRKAFPQLPYRCPGDGSCAPKPDAHAAYADNSQVKAKAYESDENETYYEAGEVGVGTGMSGSLGVPSPETLAGNSLTPVPSPEPLSQHEKAPPSYGFPHTNSSPERHRKLSDLNHPVGRQIPKAHPPEPESKAFSLRSVAKSLGDDSLDVFDRQVRRYNDIFRIGVSAHVDLMEVPFAQWIMISAWWFIMGRDGLESEVRGHGGLSPTLKQGYVNLAKAWWIVKEVTPNHPEVTKYGKASMNSLCAMIKSFGNHTLAELAEVHLNIVAHMRALTMSMKRNEKLPPPDLEIRGLNLQIMLHNSPLPQDFATLTVNNSSRPQPKEVRCVAEPFFPILIGDNGRHFSFARMFVEVRCLSQDKGMQEMPVPCILTVLRERDNVGVQIAIASQDSQINLVVSDDLPGGLAWRSTKWEIASLEMTVKLSDHLLLMVKFSEKEFKVLWGIWDYTQRTRKQFSAQKDEDLVFERTLQKFQCDDAKQFPSESVIDCRLRVFEKRSVVLDGTGQRSTKNGYRLAVISPPNLKTLSIVSYSLGRDYPILLSISRGKDDSRLILRTLPSSRRLSIQFREIEDLDSFRHLLSGTSTMEDDYRFPPLQVQCLAINTLVADPNLPQLDAGELRWRQLRVINKGPPSYGHDSLQTVGSEHLRILADCDYGTLTDRINLASGELQMSLSVADLNKIRLLRPPQSDMILSLADDKIAKKDVVSICNTLKIMLSSSTVRSYHFHSISDLHNFQTMVTGFSVLYDRVVNSFSITRRRIVVPIAKHWEAQTVRVQVIKQDRAVQLVAFFREFSHGCCMNFALRFTDMFETFSKTGLFYLRIVDAKFALPKGQEDPSREFVCLDTPEYPGEHDDVAIGFDNEEDRDRFGATLPAPVNKMSRMASLRR